MPPVLSMVQSNKTSVEQQWNSTILSFKVARLLGLNIFVWSICGVIMASRIAPSMLLNPYVLLLPVFAAITGIWTISYYDSRLGLALLYAALRQGGIHYPTYFP